MVRQRCPRALVVYDTVDLHFLRTRREQALGRAVAPDTDPDRLEADEIACAQRADLTLVVSTAERELLHEDCRGDQGA